MGKCNFSLILHYYEHGLLYDCCFMSACNNASYLLYRLFIWTFRQLIWPNHKGGHDHTMGKNGNF